MHQRCISITTVCSHYHFLNKKHLKNVGPIRHCEPPHAALPFTRCRYCRTPPLSHAACASMSTTTMTTTTTTTTRDRGDRYGPIEWAQLHNILYTINLHVNFWCLCDKVNNLTAQLAAGLRYVTRHGYNSDISFKKLLYQKTNDNNYY